MFTHNFMQSCIIGDFKNVEVQLSIHEEYY